MDSKNITPDFAAGIVQQAMRQGASAAEVVISEGVEFSVSVRLGDIETLKESASKGLGLRVLCDGRQATVASSDFSPEAITELVATAVKLAQTTSVDDTAGLPAPDELASNWSDLGLYDPAVVALSAEEKIAMALAAEQAARDFDPRIVNFEGGGLDSGISRRILANSLGFAGEYAGTSITLATVPVAKEGDQLQRDYWYDSRRSLALLETPDSIGKRAATRTLRRLGGRKVKTQSVPVVFDPIVAQSLLSDIFSAISGDAIFRKSSFLVDRLDEQIAVPELTVIDDGTLNGASGSRPFDGEGVPTGRTVVIENGILKTYLHNTYTARKLNVKTTGNASRSLAGIPSVGPNNFFIEPGTYTPEEIIRSVKNGFYITELIGFGVNVVNGDYSRGAAGIWIENGELTYPVEEVTVASNLKDMLKNLEMIGNDLEFRGRINAPTLKISTMILSGE